MSLLVLLSGSTTSQPDYSLPNLVLMAIYVGLTLVLAFVAVISIVISSTLSRNALAASDRQSREAIEAVQKQIEASERQSKEAIDAVNKQIEASERQSKEAIEAVNRQIEAQELHSTHLVFWV
jgi:F0F1-type ATP synthase membrane subunit b/b'